MEAHRAPATDTGEPVGRSRLEERTPTMAASLTDLSAIVTAGTMALLALLFVWTILIPLIFGLFGRRP